MEPIQSAAPAAPAPALTEAKSAAPAVESQVSPETVAALAANLAAAASEIGEGAGAAPAGGPAPAGPAPAGPAPAGEAPAGSGSATENSAMLGIMQTLFHALRECHQESKENAQQMWSEPS